MLTLSLVPHAKLGRTRRLGLASALLTGLLMAGTAAAQRVDYPERRGSFTPGELSMLPAYCKSMQGMPGYLGPEGARWRATIGPDLQHIHHYCRGLRDVYYLTYTPVTPVQREFLWGRAIKEYDYMIRNSRSGMPLMPEIFFRKGEALVMLGRVAEAELDFEEARKLKPDYAPPYIAWADQLLRLKLNDRAQELLLEGLRHVPDHPALLERLHKLPDGKKLLARLRGEQSAAGAAAAASAPHVGAAAVPASAPASQAQ